MNIELNVNLTSNCWEYLPLPNLSPSYDNPPKNDYELVLQFPVPKFAVTIAKYFWGQRRSHVNPPLIFETIKLIERGNLSLCNDGVGGTYFIKNPDNTTLSVFKPVDEEPGANNNPKGLLKNPLLPPGLGATREVAAYLLDRGFAGVPETHYVNGVTHKGFNGTHEKQGSIQRFMSNDGISSDVGSSVFNLEDVHRIGVLDIRIYNLDRNDENILIKKLDGYSYKLIPIDHTYSLPPVQNLGDTSQYGAYFEWQYWPQAKRPFSQSTLDYIRSINIEEDITILRMLGFPEECINTMIVSTLLLKIGAEKGLTLFEIATFMCRTNPCVPSPLEELVRTFLTSQEKKTLDFTNEFGTVLEITLSK